jgi:serine/threonine-protein kinase
MAIEESSSQTHFPQPLEGELNGGLPAPRPGGEEHAGQVLAADDKTVISRLPPLEYLQPTDLHHLQLGKALVGKRLEHYDLDEFVGGGGMGAVFRATDTRLGRTVAVKVLSRDHSDEETIRRFRNEAQSAARLDHPNIARVYYVGEDHGWNFIVFEFIEGTNLRDLVEKQGPLELPSALRYVLQVAEAIEHSSSRDVIHRDIKPSNVLVTTSGLVKLVDMGLARLHQVETSSNDLTASGVTLGTFDYISPEQAREPRSADVRSDIYSLGCTLYYMLAAQPPFPEGTALQKLIKHSSDAPPDVREFRPELPVQVAALVAKMLAKRPALRQQNAAELIIDILAVGQDLGLANLGYEGVAPLAPAASKSARWAQAVQVLAAAAVLIAATILLDLYLSSRRTAGDFVMRPRIQAGALEPGAVDSAATSDVVRSPAIGGQLKQQPEAADSLSSDRQAPAASSAGRAAPLAARSETSGPPIGPNAADQAFSLSAPPSEGAIQIDSLAGDVDPSALLEATPAARSIAAKRIVVSGDRQNATDVESEYVTTLQEAVRRAAALGIGEIELRLNGRLMERPMDIVNPRLTLRAAMGYRPIIVFQPSVTDRQMIRLTSGSVSRLSIQGVELRMELPTESADGWALIAMGTGQSLELSQCVLTVEGGDDEAELMHDQVAMIAVQPRRASDILTVMDPQLAMGQAATIGLDRCIARGEATLVMMPDEAPLTLRWKQGLLATSRRLIEIGGSATSPKWFEKIDIDLESVTAYCRQGLHQMRRGPGKAYQFALNVNTKQCIVMTDLDAPLYEYLGVTSLTDDDLQATGDFNRYPYLDVIFLRLRGSGAGEVQDFVLGRGPWSSESHSQVGIPWRPPSRNTPAHLLTKYDFVADTALPVDAGFDPLQLPESGSSVPAAVIESVAPPP